MRFRVIDELPEEIECDPDGLYTMLKSELLTKHGVEV